MERGVQLAAELPDDVVYAGFSLGVMPAQQLAQTSPGAQGALLFHACAPTSEFGTWPEGMPAQIHGMNADPFFADGGDIDAARALAAEESNVELFVYPGNQHLFADSSLAVYNKEAADLVKQRILAFLDNL
ncbi:dienelactone hydrolase family protein [Arthrobacter roseus]|uniref:dienelactone hydrolase family protein n=1 Tax=Arthrobacter roseus TaxID=136274 RepID=UPI001EF92586|nr:dienelactone hydrolase family protein [Arthrobacter roseus]MBM7847899.1 dienelactone hydrolase [Arthrobacter roseus]